MKSPAKKQTQSFLDDHVACSEAGKWKPAGAPGTACDSKLSDARKPAYLEIPSEEWRPIPVYPSLEASNLGRIRLKKTKRVLAITVGEYPRVSFQHAGKTHTVECHRLCALAWYGPIGPGLVVRHKDDNKMNCCIENLEIATSAQNRADAVRAGAIRSKLAPSDVRRICTLLKSNVDPGAIAEAFGVKVAAVQDIAAGRAWRAIPDEENYGQTENQPSIAA